MGGAEHFVLDLITELRNHDDVDARLVLLNEDEEFYDWYGVTPDEIIGFRAAWRDWPEVQKATRRLCGYLRREGIDILHSHLWIPDFIGARAATDAGCHHVSHIHNTLTWMGSRRPGFLARRIVLSNATRKARTRFIGCSRAATEHTARGLYLAPTRLATIPYCVDTARFDYERDYLSRDFGRQLTLGMAGRLVYSKGHHILLESLSRLVQRHAQIRLLIAGDGERRREIDSLIRELSLEDSVTLVGRVSNMARFFRKIDVLVQPSLDSEGLPIAILEALASGVLVLATDCAGAGEVVRDGQTGFLAEPGNVSDLTRQLERIVKIPLATAARISRNGSQVVQSNMSREVVAERILGEYHRLSAGGEA